MTCRLSTLMLVSIVLAVWSVAPAALQAAANQDNLSQLAVEGDWSIVRRPNGACLAMPTERAAATPSLVLGAGPTVVIQTPYEAGIGGFVILKVDRSDPLYMTAVSIPDPRRIQVPPDLLPEMWAGRLLVMEIDPLDRDPVRHEFSLSGLSAAAAWLDRPRCQPKSQGANQ